MPMSNLKKNTDKQIKAPYVIYSDYEFLTVPIQKCTRDPSKPAQEAYQTHVPSWLTIYVAIGSSIGINIASISSFEVIEGLDKQIVAKVQSNCPVEALTP